MTIYSYDYSPSDRQLLLEQVANDFGNGAGDYIRVCILNSNGVIRYGNNLPAIFYSSLSTTEFDIDVSAGTNQVNPVLPKTIGGLGNANDFKIYKNSDQNIYIKPNEILDEKEIAQGNYTIQIDFLNQVIAPSPTNFYEFVVREVSTSRKEIRLKVLNFPNISPNSDIINDLTNQLTNSEGVFDFNHYLNINNFTHIPIMNFQFDRFTDGKQNQSIILKLYSPIPSANINLSRVTIEREVLTTQLQDFAYFSEVLPSFEGLGLNADLQENWLNSDGNTSGFQNLNELIFSSSLDDIESENLISQSDYNYPNLNVDFNNFSNHTFFGSAKKKLENFKTKVETIQGYYSEISESLFVSSSMTGDSIFIKNKRKDLFKKIKEEFKTFTPYERFLYFDGQSESTASAPSLGSNLVDVVKPFTDNAIFETLPQHDGLNIVYKLSNIKEGGGVDSITENLVFGSKYKVQDKPFFHYSSSIYLSFLAKGDDSGSSFIWRNNNNNILGVVSNGFALPADTLYTASLQNPEITSSEYKRFIFEASASYFIPNTDENDMADLNFVQGDFDSDSSKIIILSGSVKTGSHPMTDSTNKYPTTVITQSGVEFSGSVMPAGSLFDLNFTSSLSQSLQGYLNLDNQTSGSALTNTMMTSIGPSASGSIAGVADSTENIFISDGLTSRGRQYGKSILQISESSHEVHLSKDSNNNYQFSKTDNFSLSIWAKRFHPNVSNANNNTPSASSDACGIFGRGSTTPSYGISYHEHQKKIFAGVRGTSDVEVAVRHAVSDQLTGSFHCIVLTYESSSATGLKLYFDGELVDTNDTTGDFLTQADDDFSGSASSKLVVGGNDVLGGNNGHYNGFLQYPRVYNRALNAGEVQQLYLIPDGEIDTKITDIKITLKDPTNVLPFDNIYHTSSIQWTNWYDGLITSASTFDQDNIHSFENNLPEYIKESGDYNDMKDFLNLQGEQYDIIKNHIDSIGKLNERGYKQIDSPGNNTLPMLLSNMGWQAINPFTGSLENTLGGYLSSITTIDDIKNNTWRKTLNNLIHIYKSKGTKNSVRALLNTYGYPPDFLQFQEFSNVRPTDYLIKPVDGPDIIDIDLIDSTGSISFNRKQQKLINYQFNKNENRILNFDWWMDNARINTIEFVYKHKETTNTQTILKSSGSGGETLWDLRLIPSSDALSSSFEFRLNNSLTGSLAIADNAISMSTNFEKMRKGQLWNVMLQRMTGSDSGGILNEYQLHLALQKREKILGYNQISMSVAGNLSTSNLNANANFIGSGSRHPLSSSNLFVGLTASGSLAQIKAYSTALSQSKFRAHTINKFSTVGNSIESHLNELVYHFQLNENYTSSSISSSTQTNLEIVDSSERSANFDNYSFEKSAAVFTGSIVYGSDIVDVYTVSTEDNENNIFINTDTNIIGDLSSKNRNLETYNYSYTNDIDLRSSPKLELYKSPTDFVNDFITDKISGFNLESVYGNPLNYYSQSYIELDKFRKDFFLAYPIEINVNKFIRAHENMFNHSIIEGLQSLVPARSTFSDLNSKTGVQIKPTILEKQKYENEKHSLEVNPNSPSGSHIVNIKLNDSLFGKELLTKRETIKEGIVFKPVSSSGSLELPITTSLSFGNSYVTSSGYLRNSPFKNHFHPPFLQPDGYVTKIVDSHTGSINVLQQRKKITSASVTYRFDNEHGINFSGSTVVFPFSGSNNFISTQYNSSYSNLNDKWGNNKTDVHFLNYAIDTIDTASSVPDEDRIATAAWTFTDKGNEETTITLTDFEGTSVIFEVDNDGDGAVTGSAVAMNPPTNNGAGMASILVDSVNASALKITATNPASGQVVLTQDAAGAQGNTDIVLSFYDNWNANTTNTFPLAFSGGGDYKGNAFNVAHIHNRFHFYSIGDSEYYSASIGSSSNFTDINNFYGHKLLTEGVNGNINYQHLHSSGTMAESDHLSNKDNTYNGLRMGKTRFMRYIDKGDNNRQLILPRNHITRHRDNFVTRMYEGSQNITNSGSTFLNVRDYEDYSSASFYRVNVTPGENQIYVKGKKGTRKGNDDKIIY